MLFRAMDIDVEVFWRVQLLLQPCVFFRSLSNVYFAPIWAQELTEALLGVVGPFADRCGGRNRALVLVAIQYRRRHWYQMSWRPPN